MNRLKLAVALTVLLAVQSLSPTPAAATCLPDPGPKYQPFPGLNSANYPVCYQPPNDANRAAYLALQKRHVLERYSQFLSPLHLPHELPLVALNCRAEFGGDSPFYSSADRTLHFCYEFYQDVLNAAPQSTTPHGVTRGTVITGVWTDVLMHETGHALFDMLDIPVFGREEDAADQVAAFIALQFNPEVARSVIKGVAAFWQMVSDHGGDPPSVNDPNPPKDANLRCQRNPLCAYSDEHGTAGQRLYNNLCIAYGGAPDTFRDLVQRGWLPKMRAADCSREYNQIKLAFVKTVLPFVDLQMMKKVQSTQWLQPDEMH